MPDISINNKLIAKNILFLYLRMLIVLSISLYTTRVVLRVLGVEDFGIYNVVCGFVAMFGFLNSSMSNGVQRFYNYELGKNGDKAIFNVYSTALIIQIILVFIIIALTETFGLWYLHNKMVIPLERLHAAEWIFQFSIISFVFIILQVPYSAAVMAYEKMDFFALVNIIDVLLKLGIVIALQFTTYDKLIFYGVALLIISVFNFLMYYCFAKKKFSTLVFKFKIDIKLFKSMLSFSGWNIFGTFANMMKEQGLNMIINLFFGPVVNAARGISYQITGALQGFIANNGIAIRPQLTQAYAKNDINRTIKLMYSISKLSFYLMIVMALPISLEINYILYLWLGNNIPEHTSYFTILVIAISMIGNLNSPISLVVHASGRMRNYQLITSLFSLLLIPISYFALKHGSSPETVFWLSLLFSFLNQIISLFLLKSIIPFSISDYIIKVLFPCLMVFGASFIFPFTLYSFMEQGFLRLLLVVLVACVAIGGLSYIIGIDRDERLMVKNIVSCFLKRFKK